MSFENALLTFSRPLAIVNVTASQTRDSRPLAALFDDLIAAGRAGRDFDVAGKLGELGVKDAKITKLAQDFYRAAKMTRAISSGGVPPGSYAPIAAALDKQIATTFPNDRGLRTKLERDAVELRTVVGQNEGAAKLEPVSKAKRGATIDAYDARLASLASDQPLPPYARVEAEMKAQDEEMVRLNVPQASRTAMEGLMANAYGMRGSLDREGDFKTYLEGYDRALADPTLRQTVSRDELRAFRETRDKLVAMQQGKNVETKANTDPTLRTQLDTQRRNTPRRSQPRPNVNRTPRQTPKQNQRTPQRTNRQNVARTNTTSQPKLSSDDRRRLIAQYDREIETAKWQYDRIKSGVNSSNDYAKAQWAKQIDVLQRKRAAIANQ